MKNQQLCPSHLAQMRSRFTCVDNSNDDDIAFFLMEAERRKSYSIFTSEKRNKKNAVEAFAIKKHLQII